MNKELRKILIISFAVFSTGFLVMPGTFALANDNLVVEFEATPLFDEANFLPGQSVSRWVRVINNNEQTQRIATEAINISDPDRLGDTLNLEIKEGGTTLYSKPLSTFFNAGEEFLSNLANNSTTTYDFSVSFYSGAQNPFQGKSLGFDILIGFQGEEGGILPGAGGGAGGYLPPGLTITNEIEEEIGEDFVKITWLTSYFSTSQIIYAKDGEKHILDLTDNVGAPPKYGYERTTPEYDVSLKITSHSVTISGLTPGTKYYYRAVSHASLAISKELSFTTLGTREEEMIGEEVAEEEVPVVEISLDELVGRTQEEGAGGEVVEEEGVGAEELLGVPELSEVLTEAAVKEGPIFDFGKLLAGVGGLFSSKNLPWLILLFLAIIIILLILKRRKKKE